MKTLRYFLVAALAMMSFSAMAEDIIWAEDFSSYKADDVPTGGTYSYACVDGGSPTKIYAANLAGGTAPELLVGKKGSGKTGSFTAVIPLNGKSGSMSLSFKQNYDRLDVAVTGATLGEKAVSGNTYTYPIEVASGTTSITISFTINSTSNVRLDDIKLYQGTAKKPAGLSWGKASTQVTYGNSDSYKNLPTLQNSNNLTITCTSTDEKVATVTNAGVISVVGPGETILAAIFAGNDEYEAQTVNFTLTVKPATDGPVEVGVVRPLVNGAENVYAGFDKITTADFNKSAAGLTATFFETDAIKSTIVEDKTAETGYEKKDVCHQGIKNISVDYVWKLNCSAAGASNHNAENPLGSEGWSFGFDLTVAEGYSLDVNAIDFDLLVEQNPAYCIRIMKGETELYNSTWITATGGYNNEAWGAGSYCHITKEDVSFLYEKIVEGNPVNYQALQYYPGFKDGVGVKTPLPAELKLTAGTYRVIADVDFNKDSAKAMSFDNFTLQGDLKVPTGIEAVKAANAVKADNVMYNLAGQKVDAAYKGMVIMNGRKFVNK